MQDSQTTNRQSYVFMAGFLLMLGVVIWYIGSYWYKHWRVEESVPETQVEVASDISLAELRFLTPKELLGRLSRQEAILFIDVRTKEEFGLEHIVDSISVPVVNLKGFQPKPGQFIMVISGPDIPNATLKGIHQLFTERKYTFGFLQGTISDWKTAGGTTISGGDPTSIVDYSKVIFTTPEQVMTLVDELSNPLFIDVRSQDQFKKEHIPRAINIPIAELEERRKEIPQGTSVFVYGNNDYESYQGGVRLFDLGFYGTRVIRGGFGVWKEKNLPMASEAK